MGLLYIKHCDKLFSPENTLQDLPPRPIFYISKAGQKMKQFDDGAKIFIQEKVMMDDKN